TIPEVVEKLRPLTLLDPVDELEQLVRDAYDALVKDAIKQQILRRAANGPIIKPTGTPLPNPPPAQQPKGGSTLDQVLKKLDEKADELLSRLGVPKKAWSTIKGAAKDHIKDVVDQLPGDKNLKDGLKKVLDAIKSRGEDK